VVRDYAFAADDLRHRGQHVEYRRQWELRQQEQADADGDDAGGDGPNDGMDDPPRRVTALYDYAGTELGHVSFSAGDVILINENFGNGQLLGTVHGRTGLLPESYVRPLAPDDAAAA
jgi:hypothetical protein